jgi:tripartite-type tricarboxylate transporter receptor subunit TctC
MVKRQFCALCAVSAALLTAATHAQDTARDYPSRPVRILVPNAPGSSIDTMSRILAAKLGETLGAPTVVENRDGASGLIGMEAGKNARPDGYVLISASNGSMLIAPHLRKDVPYGPADFTPIAAFAVLPNVLVVNPELPIRSVKDLIDYAKANAGKVNMASAGIGSASHLSGVLLMSMGSFESLHVPHKGGGPSVHSVTAGQTHWTITPAPAVMSFVRNGKLRAIGQSLPRRSSLLGDIPAVAETVTGYDSSGWAGLVGPKGTPRPIVDKLLAAMVKTLALPEVKEAFGRQGAETLTTTPEEFARFLQEEMGNTVKVMKTAQIQPE